MILKELTLRDWRNYDSTTITLHPTLNVFLGPNGQGKTNLLESIFYLCYGKIFAATRTASWCTGIGSFSGWRRCLRWMKRAARTIWRSTTTLCAARL